jgi:hypothetical protein
VNTGGSSSFSDRCEAVVGSTGGVTIAGSGLAFRVLASGFVLHVNGSVGG